MVAAGSVPMEVVEGEEGGSAMEEVTPREPVELGILRVLKESQAQNGLRHSDYERYRKYCAARTARLRRNKDVRVRFSTHSGRNHTWKGYALEGEDVKDERWLMIPLFWQSGPGATRCN